MCNIYIYIIYECHTISISIHMYMPHINLHRTHTYMYIYILTRISLSLSLCVCSPVFPTDTHTHAHTCVCGCIHIYMKRPSCEGDTEGFARLQVSAWVNLGCGRTGWCWPVLAPKLHDPLPRSHTRGMPPAPAVVKLMCWHLGRPSP